MDRNIVLWALIVAATIELAAIPLYGALSDRIGRRPVYLFGAVCTALTAYPIFWMLDTGDAAGWCMLALLLGPPARPRRDVRAAGRVLLGAVRHAACATAARRSACSCRRCSRAGCRRSSRRRLLQLGYGRGALSLYLIGMAAITIVSVILATETMHHDIERTENQRRRSEESD